MGKQEHSEIELGVDLSLSISLVLSSLPHTLRTYSANEMSGKEGRVCRSRPTVGACQEKEGSQPCIEIPQVYGEGDKICGEHVELAPSGTLRTALPRLLHASPRMKFILHVHSSRTQ